MAQRTEVGEGRGVDGWPRWGSGVGFLVLVALSAGPTAAALVVARAASVVGVLVAPGW